MLEQVYVKMEERGGEREKRPCDIKWQKTKQDEAVWDGLKPLLLYKPILL